MKAWCIASTGLEVQRINGERLAKWAFVPSGRADVEPLLLEEPWACRFGSANGVKLLRIGDEEIVDGKSKRRITLRLSEDGECDLSLMLPNAKHSDARSILRGLRICLSTDCYGGDFASFIDEEWDRLNWR